MTDTTRNTFCCEICAEEFMADTDKKVSAISCGHVFHENCLNCWFGTQCKQNRRVNCPKCRTPSSTNHMIRLYLFGTSSCTENPPANATERPILDNATNSSNNDDLDHLVRRGVSLSNEIIEISDTETSSTHSDDDASDSDESDVLLLDAHDEDDSYIQR